MFIKHLEFGKTAVTLTTVLKYRGGGGGGGAKSQFTYVGLNCSVTECSIEIILSGMTFYRHWFEKFVKSKHICVNFFSNDGSFSHLFDILDSRIESNFIGLCLAIRITFILKKQEF